MFLAASFCWESGWKWCKALKQGCWSEQEREKVVGVLLSLSGIRLEKGDAS